MEIRGAAQQGVVTLQRSVKQLHFGSMEEKEIAAKQVMRFASTDLKTRKSLAALGVIPSLVSMLDSHVSHRRRLAVRALIELANGTYTNKALMVEAGILSKLPKNVETVDYDNNDDNDDNDDDELTKHDFAVLLLSITSSANTQFPIFSMEFLPFIMGILDSKAEGKTKIACLGTLHNLSTMLDNVGILISSGVVIPTLLRLSSNKETSEKALATLGNLVVSVMGKKEIENDPLVPESLIEIMTWDDEKPRCQELAVYILMILAHRSCKQRKKMRQLGIVPVLLEVGLLGSTPIAQKRALKMLEWFKDDEDQNKIMGCDVVKEKKMMMMNEEKRMIQELVKQSLAKNMKVMTNRVIAVDNKCSKLGSFAGSSSRSKSSPY